MHWRETTACPLLLAYCEWMQYPTCHQLFHVAAMVYLQQRPIFMHCDATVHAIFPYSVTFPFAQFLHCFLFAFQTKLTAGQAVSTVQQLATVVHIRTANNVDSEERKWLHAHAWRGCL